MVQFDFCSSLAMTRSRPPMNVNEYFLRLCNSLCGQVTVAKHCMPRFSSEDQSKAKAAIGDLLQAIETSRAEFLPKSGSATLNTAESNEVRPVARAPLAVRSELTQSCDASPLGHHTESAKKLEHADIVVAANHDETGDTGKGARKSVFKKKLSTQELVFDYDDSEKHTKRCVDHAIAPDWMGRLYWDIGIMCLVMLDSFMLPAQLAWQNPEETIADQLWLWFTTGLFVADICASFSTAYVDGETLVTDKVLIAGHYIRGWFSIDLASTIPWSVVAGLASSGSGSQAGAARSTRLVKFIRFVRLLRMMRLAKLAAMWDRMEEMIGSLMLRHAMQIMKHMGLLVVCCHLNACVWWMLGNPDGLLGSLIDDEHWGESTELANPPWIERSGAEQYVFCFYWTLGLMRTMPAEVTPVNIVERLYILGFMFFAFSAFAICVSQISTMWIKINQRSRDFDDELSHVRLRLKKNSCDPRLTAVVKQFMKYKFDHKIGNSAGKVNQILSMLPQKMKDLINFSAWIPFLRKLSVLKGFDDEGVVRRVCEGAITEEDHPAGQKITELGRVATHCWILMDGTLKVMSSIHPTPINIVDEPCLEVVHKSEHTLITVSCAQFLKVEAEKFKRSMEKHRRNPEQSWREDPCSVGGGQYLEDERTVYDRRSHEEEAAIGTTAVLAAS